MAADGFLGAVRQDVVQTAHGPVAATITIERGRWPLAVPRRSPNPGACRRNRSTAPRPGAGHVVAAANVSGRFAQGNVRFSTDDHRGAEPAAYWWSDFETVVATAREHASAMPSVHFNAAQGGIGRRMPGPRYQQLRRCPDRSRVIELVTTEFFAAPALKVDVNVSPDFRCRSRLVVGARRATAARRT